MKGFELRSRHTAAAVLGATMILASGCATKGYVEEGLTAQDSRLAGIESGVEANQRRLRDTGVRLDEVGQDAREAETLGRAAAARADEAYSLAQGKLVFAVVLSDTAGHFGSDDSLLTDAARQRLDEVAARMKKEGGSVYLEIEGHTDATGSENYNMGLGLRRAEAARQYLNKQHGMPLHRMSVTSYGESMPVAENSTREGRAKNRRVEVRVLS